MSTTEADGLDDLLAVVGAPVSARTVWWSAWEAAFDERRWLLTVGDETDGHLRAAAPLARRTRPGWTDVVVLGHGTADVALLPSRTPADARALAEQVASALEALPGRWRLRLEHLPVDDPCALHLATLLPHATITVPPDRASPVLPLPVGATAEDLVPGRRRKSGRRAARTLHAAGLSTRVTTDPDEIATLLPVLAEIRRVRDHEQDRVSDLDDPRYRVFWEGLLGRLSARGEVEVLLAEGPEGPVAYDVAFLDGDAYRVWDGRFLPAWGRASPGRVLDDLALQRALARGATELDLLRGVTAAKMRLASEVRPVAVLEAYSDAALRRRTLGRRAARAWAKGRKDASPRLTDAWLRVKRATVLRRATGGDG